jgi:hypothetical protein
VTRPPKRSVTRAATVSSEASATFVAATRSGRCDALEGAAGRTLSAVTLPPKSRSAPAVYCFSCVSEASSARAAAPIAMVATSRRRADTSAMKRGMSMPR